MGNFFDGATIVKDENSNGGFFDGATLAEEKDELEDVQIPSAAKNILRSAKQSHPELYEKAVQRHKSELYKSIDESKERQIQELVGRTILEEPQMKSDYFENKGFKYESANFDATKKDIEVIHNRMKSQKFLVDNAELLAVDGKTEDQIRDDRKLFGDMFLAETQPEEYSEKERKEKERLETAMDADIQAESSLYDINTPLFIKAFAAMYLAGAPSVEKEYAQRHIDELNAPIMVAQDAYRLSKNAIGEEAFAEVNKLAKDLQVVASQFEQAQSDEEKIKLQSQAEELQNKISEIQSANPEAWDGLGLAGGYLESTSERKKIEEAIFSDRFTEVAKEYAKQLNRQEGADAFAKKNPITSQILYSLVEVGRAATGTVQNTVSFVPALLGDPVTMKIISDGAANFDNIRPKPSNMQGEVFDSYYNVNGNRVYVDANGDVDRITDTDGFDLNASMARSIADQFNSQPKKDWEYVSTDFNSQRLLPTLTRSGVELYSLLAGSGLFAKAISSTKYITALKAAEKVGLANKLSNNAGMFSYMFTTQLGNNYNAALETQELTNAESMAYAYIATTISAMAELIVQRANPFGEGAGDNVLSEYVKNLRKGYSVRTAMGKSFVYGTKQAIGEGGIEEPLSNLSEIGVNATVNAIKGKKVFEDDVNWNDIASSGLIAGLTQYGFQAVQDIASGKFSKTGFYYHLINEAVQNPNKYIDLIDEQLKDPNIKDDAKQRLTESRNIIEEVAIALEAQGDIVTDQNKERVTRLVAAISLAKEKLKKSGLVDAQKEVLNAFIEIQNERLEKILYPHIKRAKKEEKEGGDVLSQEEKTDEQILEERQKAAEFAAERAVVELFDMGDSEEEEATVIPESSKRNTIVNTLQEKAKKAKQGKTSGATEVQNISGSSVVAFNGKFGIVTQDAETNEWIFTDSDGNESILPVEDKNNPIESISKLGVDKGRIVNGGKGKRYIVFESVKSENGKPIVYAINANGEILPSTLRDNTIDTVLSKAPEDVTEVENVTQEDASARPDEPTGAYDESSTIEVDSSEPSESLQDTDFEIPAEQNTEAEQRDILNDLIEQKNQKKELLKKSKYDKRLSEGILAEIAEINEQIKKQKAKVLEASFDDKDFNKKRKPKDVSDFVFKGVKYIVSGNEKDGVKYIKEQAGENGREQIEITEKEYLDAKNKAIESQQISLQSKEKSEPTQEQKNIGKRVFDYLKSLYGDKVGFVLASGKEFEELLRKASNGMFGGINQEEQIQFLKTPQGTIYGFQFTDENGKSQVVIDESLLNPNTPVHELSHVWLDAIEGLANTKGGDAKKIYDSIKEVVLKDFKENGANSYLGRVMANAAYATDSTTPTDKQIKEALATAIGDKGEMLANKAAKSKFKNAFNKFFELLGKVLGIKNKTPEQIADMTLSDLALNMAVDIMAGKAETSTSSAKTDVDLMFVPPNANLNTRQKVQFETAKEMLKNGATPKEIKFATNFHFDEVDGWLLETDDSVLDLENKIIKKLNNIISKYNSNEVLELQDFSMELSDFIGESDLEKIAPNLKGVKVVLGNFGDEFDGAYSRKNNTIELNITTNGKINQNTREIASALVHEIQHAVAHKYGMSKGVSVNYMYRLLSEIQKKIIDKIARNGKRVEYDWISGFITKYKHILADTLYRNIKGEKLSRLSEERMELSEKERKQTVPISKQNENSQQAIQVLQQLGLIDSYGNTRPIEEIAEVYGIDLNELNTSLGDGDIQLSTKVPPNTTPAQQQKVKDVFREAVKSVSQGTRPAKAVLEAAKQLQAELGITMGKDIGFWTKFVKDNINTILDQTYDAYKVNLSKRDTKGIGIDVAMALQALMQTVRKGNINTSKFTKEVSEIVKQYNGLNKKFTLSRKQGAALIRAARKVKDQATLQEFEAVAQKQYGDAIRKEQVGSVKKALNAIAKYKGHATKLPIVARVTSLSNSEINDIYETDPLLFIRLKEAIEEMSKRVPSYSKLDDVFNSITGETLYDALMAYTSNSPSVMTQQAMLDFVLNNVANVFPSQLANNIVAELNNGRYSPQAIKALKNIIDGVRMASGLPITDYSSARKAAMGIKRAQKNLWQFIYHAEPDTTNNPSYDTTPIGEELVDFVDSVIEQYDNDAESFKQLIIPNLTQEIQKLDHTKYDEYTERLIQRIKHFAESGMLTNATPSELLVLQEVVDNINDYDFINYMEATAVVNAIDVRMESEQLMSAIEGGVRPSKESGRDDKAAELEADLSTKELQEIDDALGLSSIRGRVIQESLYGKIVSGIQGAITKIHEAYDDLAKIFGVTNILNEYSIKAGYSGVVDMSVVKYLTKSLEEAHDVVNMGKKPVQWLRMMAQDQDHINKFRTYYSKKKVKLLFADKHIDGMLNAIKDLYDKMPKDANGDVDYVKLLEEFESGNISKYLTPSQEKMMDGMLSFFQKNKSLLSVVAASDGQAFSSDNPFYMPQARIGIDYDDSGEVGQQYSTTKLTADATKSRNLNLGSTPLDINLLEQGIKYIRQAAVNGEVKPKMQHLKNLKRRMKAKMPTKYHGIIDSIIDDAIERVHFEFDFSSHKGWGNAFVDNSIKAFVVKALVGTRLIAEVAVAALDTPIAFARALNANSGKLSRTIGNSRSNIIQLAKDFKSPLVHKMIADQLKDINVSSGMRLSKTMAIDKATTKALGAAEALTSPTIFDLWFGVRFEQLTGERFSYNSYLTDKGYKTKFLTEIEKSVAFANAEVAETMGMGLKAADRVNSEAIFNKQFKTDSTIGKIIFTFSRYPKRTWNMFLRANKKIVRGALYKGFDRKEVVDGLLRQAYVVKDVLLYSVIAQIIAASKNLLLGSDEEKEKAREVLAFYQKDNIVENMGKIAFYGLLNTYATNKGGTILNTMIKSVSVMYIENIKSQEDKKKAKKAFEMVTRKPYPIKINTRKTDIAYDVAQELIPPIMNTASLLLAAFGYSDNRSPSSLMYLKKDSGVTKVKSGIDKGDAMEVLSGVYDITAFGLALVGIGIPLESDVKKLSKKIKDKK